MTEIHGLDMEPPVIELVYNERRVWPRLLDA